ncbi:MAG: bifunctional phosphoribosylaminoimidazolecarboxamide formyltransferase/IMP cyclohydrolase [Elusimicrobiota bacterium]|jgi:phosphoribosylaminoimidazolecarboxamide formyltransferase/IMP cyclohydrolase|nr:bifunctional phosphoribosylaminoimidazolecarboxamide formyltransferase/IMP cyclohydrolase [Elusimicrobiota bacterium]
MKRVLISVSDKKGIVDFAKSLVFYGWEIISSGGTAKVLKENSINCKEISEVTGFPEILDGRVKTLNPKIHGGILAVRNKKEHLAELEKHSILPIDMVVVNLYPFEETIASIEKPRDKNIDQKVIENIDIGGVALLRAAAKNYKDVLTVCDYNDYERIIENINNLSDEFRLELAAKAFRHTAYYDALISNYLSYEKFPSQSAIALKKVSNLRYGENPHQSSAVYACGIYQNTPTVLSAKQFHGKELSYNNYLDLEAAWRLVNEFEKPACAIIKHNNPCGCAEGENQKDAYLKALMCDPVSAFGGIIAFNAEVDEASALEIKKLFVECVIAPDFSLKAIEILTQKKNIRLLKQEIPYRVKDEIEYKTISAGMLAQDRDNKLSAEIKNMTKRTPNSAEKESLIFAWKVCKHVKSNAIILVRKKQTVGIGAGQMSRIDSLHIALKKMNEIEGLKNKIDDSHPLVLASDAFFPFPDTVKEAAKNNVRAIIQPAGSINDEESIKEADKNDIAMIATGMRHFKH